MRSRWAHTPAGAIKSPLARPSSDELVPWLALNREGLVLFVHPNTGEDLEDHRDRAIWLGAKLDLKLEIFE